MSYRVTSLSILGLCILIGVVPPSVGKVAFDVRQDLAENKPAILCPARTAFAGLSTPAASTALRLIFHSICKDNSSILPARSWSSEQRPQATTRTGRQ